MKKRQQGCEGAATRLAGGLEQGQAGVTHQAEALAATLERLQSADDEVVLRHLLLLLNLRLRQLVALLQQLRRWASGERTDE